MTDMRRLLAIYMAATTRQHAAERIRDARSAHSGLLKVFFQVEGDASTAEMRAINRILEYLDKHIKRLEAAEEANDHYRAAMRGIELEWPEADCRQANRAAA